MQTRYASPWSISKHWYLPRIYRAYFANTRKFININQIPDTNCGTVPIRQLSPSKSACPAGCGGRRALVVPGLSPHAGPTPSRSQAGRAGRPVRRSPWRRRVREPRRPSESDPGVTGGVALPRSLTRTRSPGGSGPQVAHRRRDRHGHRDGDDGTRLPPHSAVASGPGHW